MKTKIATLLLVPIFLLSFFTNISAEGPQQAQSGMIDLNNSSSNELTPLNGEWFFYLDKLLHPRDLQIHQPTTKVPFPGLWSNYWDQNGKGLPKQGHGTFQVTLNIPERDIEKQKALYIPTVKTAYRLYIDGKLMGEVGKVGISKETMIPKYLPQVFTFMPQSKKVEIVIQTSNYYHIKSGVRDEILYGDADAVIAFKEKEVAQNSFLFGIFILISLYHLLFFFKRKNEIRSLAFALFSLVIATRIVVIDQTLLVRYFPDFNWILLIKFEYLTVFLGFFLYIIFLKTLYPKEWNGWIYRSSLVVTGALSLIVIFTGPGIFTNLLKPFGLIALVLIIYFFYVMFMAMLHKREGAIISFSMGLFFYITVMNDLLHYNGYIQSISMVPFGFFIFLFSQFIMLTQEYAKSFNEANRLNDLLQNLNGKLEERVKAQTESLEQSMKETAIALSDKMVLEERNRLIGEIHDTVGHTLTTINIQIEAGKRLIEKKPSDAKEKLERSQEQIRIGLNEIRNSLRLLKDHGQGSSDYLFSLRNLILNTEKSTGVSIKAEMKVTTPLSIKQQSVLYRALQEGLTNGIRHGESNNFNFSLYESDEYIIFMLEDNGKGVGEIQPGLGLSMMKARVEELHGEMYIESNKGKGFSIEICLPIK
ncbi:7TM diverse intracellular signaling domain-containing protein [Calidifontibacillus oryziterrae]|uniref:7TM diverse intracellular signaling domain-containing protein n=1 Tax=Calidifontibacillus oryziterrae TaxID=1191699 RepID=UPI0003022924|nr:7TM diverse intracellular signaling domain-containing protein [Calidifontibacillus oryziterrae]